MFKNISIKHKLYFIVLVPMCIVLYTSYVDMTKKYSVQREVRKTLNKNILHQKIVSFLNTLEKERAISSIYVLSHGKYFSFEHLQQIDLTKQRYEVLISYFKNFQDYKKNKLYNNLIQINHDLNIMRNNIQVLSLSYNTVVGKYSLYIKRLIDQIYTNVKKSNNIKLINIMYAQASFLSAQENDEMKRILITKILFKHKYSKIDQKELSKLVYLEKLNLDYSKKFLENKLLLKQYNIMIDKDTKSQIQKIQQILLDKSITPNYDAIKWFGLVQNSIDEKYTFSDLLSSEIIKISIILKNEIADEMLELFYLNIIILLLFFVFVIYFYSDISRRFDNIISSISFISEHNISKYKSIKIKSNDELDKISTKFNEMVDELKIREIRNRKVTIDLLKSNQKVEKNNRRKSEFLANMSHEIRTPLNAIVGFIDILKDEEINTRKIGYLNIIQNSSKNLLELINDILDFSKIESSKIVLEYRDINIIDELKFIVDLFTLKIEEKKINLLVDIDNKIPKIIKTDTLKLRQIILNLISNAIKFTDENKNINFKVFSKNNRLYISVKDEGIGIEPIKQKVVFEAFLQADNSTTRKYGGTGLGLAISSRFVDALGGTLELKSAVNKGSEFYFDIPFTVSLSPNVTFSKSEPSKILNGSVLLVEDNKSNQLFMEILLKKIGLKCDIANDGLEAVTMFEQTKYDVIFMDENMPNLSGIEATQEIIKIERIKKIKHTPIIALTANALVGDEKRFLDAGMDEYLTKPINKKLLHKVLEDFLIL